MRRNSFLILPTACLVAGSAMAGSFCFDTPTAIPGNSALGVDTSIDIACGDPEIIQDLNLLVQIQHTFVGDLIVTLSKDGGPAEVLIDRPGAPRIGPFGCSGDDIDAVMNDEGSAPAESQCAPAVPTIQGQLVPGDPPAPLMASFDGLELCGTWTVNVADISGADLGSIQQWCLLLNQDDSPGEDVPATSGVGLAVAILTFLAVSAYLTTVGYRGRRRAAGGGSA